MMINPVITYGELFQAFVTLCAFVGLFVTMRMDIKFQSKQIEDMRVDLDDMAKALESVARQDERLKNIERVINVPRL